MELVRPEKGQALLRQVQEEPVGDAVHAAVDRDEGHRHQPEKDAAAVKADKQTVWAVVVEAGDLGAEIETSQL